MTVDPPPVAAHAMSGGAGEASAPPGSARLASCPPGDQRAAGVIRGEDPYRELELYLEKVQDELGEVFDQWKTANAAQESDVVQPVAFPPDEDDKIGNTALNIIESSDERLTNQRRNGRGWESTEDEAWSQSIVAEVNSIICEQLRVLGADELVNTSSRPGAFGQSLHIRETTPNSLSPTASSVTWPSECSLYDTCRDGIDEDSKSTTTCSSCNSKEEFGCECLGSADSLDAGSGSGVGERCWRRRADAPRASGFSAENLLADSRSEEVDSGIGILSDGQRSRDPAADEDSGSDKQTLQLMLDLGTKSSSDPVLKQREDDDHMSGVQTAQKKTHSQSDQQLTEIEVVEACKWLKAAGFPQYAQMYEELPFPVDLSKVKEDHPFLDPDSLRSLYRRLGVLNRCALLRLDVYKQHHKPPETPYASSSGTGTGATSRSGTRKEHRGSKKTSGLDDSDDEDNRCALSDAWTYQTRARRWSRVDDPPAMVAHRLPSAALDMEAATSHESRLRVRDVLAEDGSGAAAGPSGANFQRSNSERIRDGAKAFLRHVESFKTRRRKRLHREGIVISDPQAIDLDLGLDQKLNDLHCVDISPGPLNQTKFLFVDDTSSCYSEGSQSSMSGHSGNAMSNGSKEPVDDKPCNGGARARRFLQPRDESSTSTRCEDGGALSDSDCQPRYFRDANSNHTGKIECTTLDRRCVVPKNRLMRSGSLTVKPRGVLESQRPRRDSDTNVPAHGSRKPCEDFFSQSPIAFGYVEQPKNVMSQLINSATVLLSLHGCSADSSRLRWHSFQEGHCAPEEPEPEVSTVQDEVAPPDAPKIQNSLQIVSLSCGQLQVLRKLALVTLTGYMEKFCPTHRTGWNWELPKFIRKTKTPDYKDKVAFGVPLTVTMQRTGHALPRCIQKALLWLQNNALEQVGLFRKSGVKSRIQGLKQMIEACGDFISFDGQQAYDVADVVKQYFRELPEALLTNKLSETFIAIFQDVPECKQHDAISCALLLLPDEHREALQTLLEFLSIVAEQVHHNQMTIRNIAVCLAPSLFHSACGGGGSTSLLNGGCGNGTPGKPAVSPRRKKATGIPDAKELNATKASHDCLQFMIREHKSLFRVTQDSLDKCNFNYMDESVPLFREELGADTNQSWLGYQYECTTALLKEARKESRGWVSIHTLDPLVDVAYKKVGDGHPLRLWRVTTEVEAPPLEVLNSILHERPVWDPTLLRCFVVERPELNCDVFCYTVASMASLPAREFCVVRSWRTDLNKGACSMVETSVKRPMAYTSPAGSPKTGNVYFGAITGVVLASRYFIEPCGSGRSKVMHLSRVDTKGRTLEFYTKIYGHICASHLTNLRKAFVIKSEGPESKV